MATYFLEVVTDAPDVDEGLTYVTAQENARRVLRNASLPEGGTPEPILDNTGYLLHVIGIALESYKNEYLNNRVAPIAEKYKAAPEAVRLEAEDAVKDVVIPGDDGGVVIPAGGGGVIVENSRSKTSV